MTKEELKEQYPMTDIARRYGFIPDRKGFICCPFHKERTASMKLYKDSYYCFGCGESGDIFSFVQRLDNVTFKEAFYSLGGAYEKPSFTSSLAVYRAKKKRDMECANRQKKEAEKRLTSDLIEAYRLGMNRSEPLSVIWCECYNKMQYQLHIFELLSRKEVGI